MIKIEHEEILNYMPFNIKNKAESDGVKIGDKINFEVKILKELKLPSILGTECLIN